jgi:hypothetical protein
VLDVSGEKRPPNLIYVQRTANVAMWGHDFTAKFTARFDQQENPQFGGGDDGGQAAPLVDRLGGLCRAAVKITA